MDGIKPKNRRGQRVEKKKRRSDRMLVGRVHAEVEANGREQVEREDEEERQSRET